jgi:hypothetical protein
LLRIAIGFLDAGLIAVADGGLGFGPSALAVRAAAAAEGSAFVVQKPLLERYSPLEFMTYAVWIAQR